MKIEKINTVDVTPNNFVAMEITDEEGNVYSGVLYYEKNLNQKQVMNADEFWDLYDTYDASVRLRYLEQGWGDILYETSRDWEDFQAEVERLERINREMNTYGK